MFFPVTKIGKAKNYSTLLVAEIPSDSFNLFFIDGLAVNAMY